jgi:preprotein translocase subunit SecB
MKRLLELNDFWMTKLHIDWAEKAAAGRDPQNPYINYNVRQNPKDKRQLALDLFIRVCSKGAEASGGYLIEAALIGIFTFSPEATDDEIQTLIRINGGTILYGVLRGIISSATGSFAGEKYTLPTVYFHELIPLIEKRKEEAHKQQEAKENSRPPQGKA